MPPDALALIRRAKAEAKKAAAVSAPADAPAALPPLEPLELAAVPAPSAPIAALPPSVHYLPAWVSEADEARILQRILDAPAARWTPGNGRRTQNWGGRPGEQRVVEPLPEWLRQLVDALVSCGAWPDGDEPPNHVIINDYSEPSSGLTPHTDGPLYADCVAVLSLMADVVLCVHGSATRTLGATRSLGARSEGRALESRLRSELHEPCDTAFRCEPATRLGRMLLRRRSLNVLRGEAYRAFHGIPAASSDVVDASVVNVREAGGAEGEHVPRVRRVSIVFVAKRAEPVAVA